jgi:hypothetical protein
MFKSFLATNLFVFAVGVLQLLGAVKYFKDGSLKFAILYFLYALTNFVIWICRGE